ncbi:NUDIX domain-containing protein [Colletotrichum tofieldiae]|nr:NUDIX domain-containing protein [Colletotrichum tofieldiae]
MPPAPPSPPLSYTTAPALLPYTLRFHPYNPSAAAPDVYHTHRLCVGAAVLSLPPSPSPSNPPRILILRRSTQEKALPNRWELPGGAAESIDGDSLAAAARELWEETGLRAKRRHRNAGAGGSGLGAAQGRGGDRGERHCGRHDRRGAEDAGGQEASKGTVAEAGLATEKDSHKVAKGRDAWRKYTYLVEVETPADRDVEIVIDPEEHNACVWAREEEVRAGRVGDVVLEWTSETQKLDVLRAFEMAKKY